VVPLPGFAVTNTFKLLFGYKKSPSNHVK